MQNRIPFSLGLRLFVGGFQVIPQKLIRVTDEFFFLTFPESSLISNVSRKK